MKSDISAILNVKGDLDKLNENDSSLQLVNTIPLKPRMIKYDVCFNVSNNKRLPEISFDDVDKYDFEHKPFVEFLISEDYVHLYFDFDSIKSEDELMDVYTWLDEVKSVFGPYTSGGYTNDENIADNYGLRYYPEGNHYISIHAIYYTTCISTKDLELIMKHTKNQGFTTEGVHELCDPNVYKLVSKKENQTTRQLFRHVLSDKIYKTNDPKNKPNHGYLLDGAKLSDHIVQIRGNEPIINKDKWSELFTIKDDVKQRPVKIDKESVKPILIESQTIYSDLNCDDGLIKISDDEIIELLHEWDPEYENFTKVVANLLHSPFDIEDVRTLIHEWYDQRNHTNDNTIDTYIDRYYTNEMNNKWFFSILKHLDDDDKRKYWLSKINPIDIDAKIEIKDSFSLKNLRETDYSLSNGKGINVNKFISDLKKCVTVINYPEMLYIVKGYDGVKDTTTLSILDHRSFKTLMSSINVGYYFKNNKWKSVDAFMIYNEGKNKNNLMKDGMRFYDKRENMFSFFTGYDYDVLDNVDEDLIKPFLNHIKEVISDNNEEVYEYILSWIAFILQNPDGKTITTLVINGEQGTGKNVFTDVIAELMNRYAIKNLTNIDQIIGKFNSVLENKKLIVCNELSSADTNKYLNSDSLKAVITQKEVMINQKNMKERENQNVVNLIMVSNNFAPVNIESDDRRYIVTTSSSKYKGNFDYFESLCNSFDKKFYDNLLTFFMKRDISDYNPRKIPMTKIKQAIQDISKSAYETFIQDYIKDFIDGIERQEAYNLYVNWAKQNGFSQANIKTFKGKLLPFVNEKQVRRYGRRPHVYILKEDQKCKFDLTANDEDEEDVI